MQSAIKHFVSYTFLLFLIQFTACHNHDHAHDHSGHDHSDHDDHGDHDNHNEHSDHQEEGNKSVHLNEAQFLNAEIDTGWFVEKNLTDVVHANGYTKLDPQDQAEISMPLSGTIKSIKVIEGNYVKKGQTLATMTSLELNEKILEIAKLEEGLAISQAKLVYLEQEHNRQKALADENINARKNYEKTVSDLAVENAKIKSHNNQISILKNTANIFGNNNSGVISITAPISGHITDIGIKIGASIDAGHQMFFIVDNSKMHVDLLIYEKDIAKVEVGQSVRFNITNQSNTEIKGEIYNMGKSFANDTKSIAVHADIEDNDSNLIPGMFINALIDIGSNKVNALPEEAIILAEGKHFIFLLGDKDDDHQHDETEEDKKEYHFERLEVKTGSKQLGFIEVTPLDEIAEGMKIVTQGAYYIQSHLQKEEGGGGHHH